MKYLFRIIKIHVGQHTDNISRFCNSFVSVAEHTLGTTKSNPFGRERVIEAARHPAHHWKGHVFPLTRYNFPTSVSMTDKAIRYYMPKNSLLDLPGRNYCKNDWFSRLYNFMISKFLFKKRIPIPRSTCNLSSIASRRTNHRPSICIPKSIRYSPVGEK